MGSKLDTRFSVDMSVVVFIVILLIRSVEDIPENGEISGSPNRVEKWHFVMIIKESPG